MIERERKGERERGRWWGSRVRGGEERKGRDNKRHLDGVLEALAELLLGAEEALLDEVHHGVVLLQVVLDRRPR